MTAPALSVVVLGAGVAGLAATLALARDGHRVTLVERDQFGVGEPLDAVDWDRKGIPHFHQPHAFTPRGRKEMRETFPDVYDALIAAGAWDLDLRPKIKGDPEPEDVDLVFLAVRRPLIEWALRRAVAAEEGVTVAGGTRATGLMASATNGTGAPPIVRGVQTTTGTIGADLVIDAMGRRTPTPEWIEAIGGRSMSERSTDCSIIYYSRYYRVREGQILPDGPSAPGPRGDLGYAAFTTFPGDNGTFCALIATPPSDQELKSLRHAAAFEAAVATMPALNGWTNADMAEPITDVLPMGSLHNTIRSFDDGRRTVPGLIGVGDALVHTDPSLSLGLSFALLHAKYVASSVRDHANDLEAIGDAFEAMARPEMEERYAYVAAIDDTRTRLWAGETIDHRHADGGAYAFFTYAAAGVASLADGDLARALFRRHGFLDPLAVLDNDPSSSHSSRTSGSSLVTAPRATRVGPPRDELLEVIGQAVG